MLKNHTKTFKSSQKYEKSAQKQQKITPFILPTLPNRYRLTPKPLFFT